MVNENNVFFNNIDDKDVIENYEEPSFYSYRCPVCGSSHIVRNGTYKRKVLYFNGEVIKTGVITIQKFLCRECDHSFHHEPYFVCARSRFSIGVILSVLFADKSIKETAKNMDISRSVVRRIRKRWKYEKKKIESIKKSINSLKELVNEYENKFGKRLFCSSTNFATYST